MFPPEVEQFFADERAKQKMCNTISKTQKNLNETLSTMGNMLEKVHQRNAVLEECEEQSEDLLESSEAFHLALLPGWKRYLYTIKMPWWWWWCSCWNKRKNKK